MLYKEGLKSKELNHKRFLKNGRQFLLISADFLLLSIRCGLVETWCFERNFVKTYTIHRAEISVEIFKESPRKSL